MTMRTAEEVRRDPSSAKPEEPWERMFLVFRICVAVMLVCLAIVAMVATWAVMVAAWKGL